MATTKTGGNRVKLLGHFWAGKCEAQPTKVTRTARVTSNCKFRPNAVSG